MTTPNAPSVRDKQVRTVATRQELEHRRQLAAAATPGPWVGQRMGLRGGRIGVVVSSTVSRRFVIADRDQEALLEDGQHIAANDPPHVLATLDVHTALLDVVALHSLFCDCDACTVADRLLDLYAPEQS